LLSGSAWWHPWLLTALALAVVAGLVTWLWRQPDPLLAVGVGLVSGGALGNVIDRIRLGAVVDFLDFYLGGWHWPAFNMADSAIAIGVGVLLFDGLFREPARSKE
jgi:signal peptidase II